MKSIYQPDPAVKQSQPYEQFPPTFAGMFGSVFRQEGRFAEQNLTHYVDRRHYWSATSTDLDIRNGDGDKRFRAGLKALGADHGSGRAAGWLLAVTPGNVREVVALLTEHGCQIEQQARELLRRLWDARNLLESTRDPRFAEVPA